MERLKRNLISDTVALLLASFMLISSLTFLPTNTGYAAGSNMTFVTGQTITFSSNTEMTFKTGVSMDFSSGVSMSFGTGVRIVFFVNVPMLDYCTVGMMLQGILPEPCTWWELLDLGTMQPTGIEFHVDENNGIDTFHIDQVRPQPTPVAPGASLIAERKIDSLEFCDYFVVHSGPLPEPCSWWEVIYPSGIVGEFHVDSADPGTGEFHVDDVLPSDITVPPPGIYEIIADQKMTDIAPCDNFLIYFPIYLPSPCTWWEIMDPIGEPTGYEFHVDSNNKQDMFHVDNVYPGPYVFPEPVISAAAEQKIVNITACNSFVVVNPQGFNPATCSWWEIIDPATGAPTGLEFHVDASTSGTFHVDQVKPGSPITIPWGPSYTVTVRKKIDVVQQCQWFRVDDIALTPEQCSWWKIISPWNLDDVEFHVDIYYPENGTFHVDDVDPPTSVDPPIYQIVAERKIQHIKACDTFAVIDPLGFVPEVDSKWKIVSPSEWADKEFHVDWNDGESKFHIDQADVLPPGPIPPPWNVTAKPVPKPPPPCLKPPYPDYSPSGMPDFDERQDNWYWRYWAFPDAVAVWQHYNVMYNDWDIYYSIYTEPNIWWTLGTDNARSLVLDWPGHGVIQYIAGDDKEPAISWYSSNYAIAVWQHWNGADWDIWYSRFIPNIGWTTPGSLHGGLALDDTDPAIAFDTNGWAICVWVHGTAAGPRALYYSIWNPNTLSWIGPNNAIGGAGWPGKSVMPEVDIDSQHNVVVIWTDGANSQEYYTWAAFNVPMPPYPVWANPAIIPGCPIGVNWQKGISPDNLGNSLIDFGLPAPSGGAEPLYYAQFMGPGGWIPASTQFPVPTNGEHPDLAFDLNNKAIAVYTDWAPTIPPAGQIYFSYWNGVNWQPPGGAFAASANAIMDQWPAIAFMKNNKAILVWQAYPEPGGKSEIYYSVYTPPYPPGSWTLAATIMPLGIFLTGDDFYVDIASPTGSPTTPPSIPPSPPTPAQPYWTWCGPLAVANSIWWFDSKYDALNVTPPTISDNFPLVRSYNLGVWDDHDPQNVQPFVEHLAYLMDTDGMRTKLCHDGTTVWDMQAGITHYLSWSGVNPLGDVDGDGMVTQNDWNLVNAAMGSTPGTAKWNLAADIWPETVTGPYTADNIIDQNDLDLVNDNLGKKGMFYEHTIPEWPDVYPSFYTIEEEVMKCQDVVLCLGFYENGIRDGGHFVTVAGVNSTTVELVISNPIRDDFEAKLTTGESPVNHTYPHDSTVHNNASLVSHDNYTVVYNSVGGYWSLQGYFADPAWEARIEYAVITSLTGLAHDVAVTNVRPKQTNVGVKMLPNSKNPFTVDPDFNCTINVTVTNKGNFTETFKVKLYALNMPPALVIGTITVSNLLSGETRTISYKWNTTGFAKANYTISAEADIVPGEITLDGHKITDNNFIDGEVKLTVPGDVIGPEFLCDIQDTSLLIDKFLAEPGDPRWDVNCDVNDDGVIDIADISISIDHFLMDP